MRLPRCWGRPSWTEIPRLHSRAMLMAIRRASSFVSILAWKATVVLSTSRDTREPARWPPGRYRRPASCRLATVRGSGGMSSGGRRAVVWPPSHRRDRQRRSLARTDPAGRGKPAWVPESVRLATAVGDLQGDVFIEGSALDRLPPVTFRRGRPHCAFPSSGDGSSISRVVLQSKTGRTITSVPRGVSPSPAA
jgi:hypothetical protein